MNDVEVKVKFKVAEANDIPKIIDLCNLCFSENSSLQYATRVFEKMINFENQIHVIGIIDDTIVAYTLINVIPTMFEEMKTYAIVNHVCVDPKYRRHNVATHMFDEIVNICKQIGCKSIKLWSNNFREAAHAFYKKYGFEVCDAKFFSMNI